MKTVYAVMDQSRSEYWPATLESLHETRESAEQVCVAVREAYRKYESECEKEDPSDYAWSILQQNLQDLGCPSSEGDVYVKEWEVKP